MTHLVARDGTTSEVPGAQLGASERDGLGGPADTASVAATRPTTSPDTDACLSSQVGEGGSAPAGPPLQLADPREAAAFERGAAMGFVCGFECALEQSRDRIEQIVNHIKTKEAL